MLMTYGAGSVGLNLQFASYVFLFDRWWNPAVEDQAINRAHRIGAERPVTVTRFLAVDTIEQRINEILERKRELFDAVFGDRSRAPRAACRARKSFRCSIWMRRNDSSRGRGLGRGEPCQLANFAGCARSCVQRACRSCQQSGRRHLRSAVASGMFA